VVIYVPGLVIDASCLRYRAEKQTDTDKLSQNPTPRLQSV